jgi:hypothetical protein
MNVTCLLCVCAKSEKGKVFRCLFLVCVFVMYKKHQVGHELLQAEKRTRTDGPQALLKKVDLDHLLDFVHGEKPG